LRLAPGEPGVLYQLGLTAEDAGEYDRAQELFQEGLAEEQRGKSDLFADKFEWRSLQSRVAHKQGDRVRARQLLDEELAIARLTWANDRITWALYGLAELDWAESQMEQGYAALAEGLNLAYRDGSRQFLAYGLLVAAEHSADISALARAIRLFGAAERIIPRLRFEWDEIRVGHFQQSLAATRAAMEPEAFAAAWAEGQAMTLEEAVAYASEGGNG
jgi:tetratricopeptide (TPR) repeat protein